MRNVWRRWLRFIEILGTIQMVVMLSLIYWTFLIIIAIPFQLFADSLTARRSKHTQWVVRPPSSQLLESMRKQY